MFLFFLLSFFVALVAAIYRLVYTMIIKFRLTQRFRRSTRSNFRCARLLYVLRKTGMFFVFYSTNWNNFRNGADSNSAIPPYPYMEEPPSYISLFPECIINTNNSLQVNTFTQHAIYKLTLGKFDYSKYGLCR